MKEFNPGFSFLSNRLEALFEQFKENLFLPSSTPFSKRLVLVPSRATEHWLQIQLAQDPKLQIACGLTTIFLNKGVEKLKKLLFQPTKNYFIPSQIELTLRIDQEIERSLASSELIWKPLIHYLKAKEHRQIVLAEQLATLFTRYGVYGKESCAQWEKKPTDWQEALWKRIFCPKSHLMWDYPIRILQNLAEKQNIPDLTVHLFSFSHLSPLYFHFLQKVGQMVPLFFYQLSFCQEFWSDLPSDRAASHLPEYFLEDRHPLLANFGKVGQKMAHLIEESELIGHEIYRNSPNRTQLERIQHDLLCLENSGEKPIDDDSIQIHAVTTTHQEIKNLHALVLTLLEKEEIEPKDISVFAPNIIAYLPYIQANFGKKIPFHIVNVPMTFSNSQLRGLFLLLELEKKRWSAPALLELFNHPLFLKQQKWKKEELFQIREWIQSTGIRWGVDEAHRESLLKQRHCQKISADTNATWKAGIDFLLEELAIPYEKKKNQYHTGSIVG